MAHIPFAFSVHHFVTSVGSYAGFGSIIGLAILVLLYFAQARETSTLRDRADEAELRAGQLEARLEARIAQASRAQAAHPPPGVVQRPAAVARPLVNPVGAAARIAPKSPAAQHATAASAGAAHAGMAAAAVIPSAPAGVGAPPLSAATRLIPAPAAAASPALAATAPGATAAAATAAAATAPDATAAAATAAAATAAATPAPATSVPAPATSVPAPPPPATVAGAAARGGSGSNGTSEEFAVAVADPSPFAAPAPAEPVLAPLPRVQLRPGGAQTRAAAPSLRRPAPPRAPSRIGRGFVLLFTGLGVIAAVVVLLIVTSSGGGKTASTGRTKTTNAPSAHHRGKAKSFNTSAVTVAVLNGTATSGLAARLSQQLAGHGYKQGLTANAASQTQTSTIVSYLAGHKADAVAVAKSLKLPSSSVQPVDSTTLPIACPQTSSCAVDVVVTVGQDLANG